MLRFRALALVAVAACHDDRPHVFQSPPPSAAAQRLPASAAAPVPKSPELPTGSRTEARITAIRAIDTGTPIVLTNVDRAFLVTVVAARGPGTWTPDSRARIELRITGTEAQVHQHVLGNPAPSIVAHEFAIPTRRESPAGLRPGTYMMELRLIMRDDSAIAISLPTTFTVR